MASSRHETGKHDVKNETLSKIGEVLSSSNVHSIQGTAFASLEIKTCNATESYSFPKAYIQYTPDLSVPLWLFWHGAICQVLENVLNNELVHEVDEATKCLINFLQSDHHRTCLLALKDATTKAEVQAILGHHLFAPLQIFSTYRIDMHHFPPGLRKCPACNAKLQLGNTSLGNLYVWHGHADILVGSCTIVVDCDKDEDLAHEHIRTPISEHLSEQRFDIDSASSYCLNEDISDVDGFTRDNELHDMTSDPFENRAKVLSQTIVNAFCEAKRSPHFSELCIPSFRATRSTVSIHMYNCSQDRLYTSPELPLYKQSTGIHQDLDIGTIVCVWLALNFEKSQSKVPENVFKIRHFRNSNFQKSLEDTLPVYREFLTKPLQNTFEKTVRKEKFKLSQTFHTIKCDFVGQVLSKLQNCQSLYEAKYHK